MPTKLWKPGESANPKGRPKGIINGAAQAKKWADERGYAFLIDVADGKKVFTQEIHKDGKVVATYARAACEASRISSAMYLMDRAYGRPKQSAEVELSGSLSLAEDIALARKRIGL